MYNVFTILLYFSVVKFISKRCRNASFVNKLLTILENPNDRVLTHFAEGLFIL